MGKKGNPFFSVIITLKRIRLSWQRRIHRLCFGLVGSTHIELKKKWRDVDTNQQVDPTHGLDEGVQGDRVELNGIKEELSVPTCNTCILCE